MMIQLRDFRAVILLSEEAHFGRASERLGMTQPQLSLLIKRLETSFGIPLFRRRPTVKATAAGEIMVDAARHLLSEFESGLTRAKAVHSGEAGLVRLGFASSAMLSHLPAALASFQTLHSGARLRVREMHSASLAEAIGNGLVELTVTRERPVRSDLAHDLLIEEPFILVERADAHGRGRIDPRDLHQRRLILFRREIAPSLFDQIYRLAAAGGTPEIVQQADEWHSIFGLVESGLGAAIAPAGLKKLAWRPLTVRRIDSPEKAQTWISWNSVTISALGLQLVEHLKATVHLAGDTRRMGQRLLESEMRL